MKKAARKQAFGLPFYKLHGAGNDCVVFRAQDLPLSDAKKAVFLRKMAHRQMGIGCDQFIELLSITRKVPNVQIWNCDGSKAEICANGVRTFLFLAAREGWIPTNTKSVKLAISGRPYEALKVKSGYELCLGTPKVSGGQTLQLAGAQIPYTKVNVGNPHAVLLLTNEPGAWAAPKDFSFRAFGPQIEIHPDFPQKTNVEFIRSYSQKGKVVTARVEAWERGAGATLSCGSGAVAAAAVLHERTGSEQVQIQMTDFLLQVRFEDGAAYLSGPSALIATGKYFS